MLYKIRTHAGANFTAALALSFVLVGGASAVFAVVAMSLPAEARAAPATITVAKEPSEGGKVTGEGIDCGTDCSESFEAREFCEGGEPGFPGACWDYWGTDLTATPADRYAFDRWENCPGPYTNHCNAWLDPGEARAITAHFRLAECADGRNNDSSDEKVDYPDDPDCESASDDFEATSPPPLTVRPATIGVTNDNTPTLEFSSTESGVTFRCMVSADSPFYEPVPGYRYNNYTEDNCSSPFTTKPLPEGSARISVIARDAKGYETWERRTLTVDTIAPTVASVSPEDNDTSADPAGVSVTFSEPMNREAAEAAFSLVPTDNPDANVSGSFSWEGNTMTFDPAGYLSNSKGYTATLESSAQDAAGNNVAAEKRWAFTTRAPIRETAYLSETGIFSGKLRAGDYIRLAADDNSYYQVNSTTSGSTRVTDWYGDFYDVSDAASNLKVSYKGKNSATCTQRLYAYRFDGTTGWTQLDSRSVGTTEVLVADRTPSGDPADYVEDPWGTVRIRVRCTRSSGFYASGDLMRLRYERP
jgi:hypothetical protein